jgi:uncharacterized repeat protein (TIGR04042 family)
MPEMRFNIVWPDGSKASCYSPSLVIAEHMAEGASYEVADFVERSRVALNIASERVRAKYGFACSSALDQLDRIEREASRFSAPGAQVTVVSFES